MGFLRKECVSSPQPWSTSTDSQGFLSISHSQTLALEARTQLVIDAHCQSHAQKVPHLRTCPVADLLHQEWWFPASLPGDNLSPCSAPWRARCPRCRRRTTSHTAQNHPSGSATGSPAGHTWSISTHCETKRGETAGKRKAGASPVFPITAGQTNPHTQPRVSQGNHGLSFCL